MALDWQLNGDDRALSFDGFDRQPSMMLVDETPYDREPEPGTPLVGSGRKERIAGVFEHKGRHTFPVVSHDEQDAWCRCGAHYSDRELDVNGSTRAARLKGVADEVEDHLLQLVCVGDRTYGRSLDVERECGRHTSRLVSQELDDGSKDDDEIDRRAPISATAGDGQELLDDPSDALCLAEQYLGDTSDLRVGRAFGEGRDATLDDLKR